jgi:hypothetical protein
MTASGVREDDAEEGRREWRKAIKNKKGKNVAR